MYSNQNTFIITTEKTLTTHKNAITNVNTIYGTLEQFFMCIPNSPLATNPLLHNRQI